MSINSFDELLQKVRESITKNYTQLRNPITPEERLTVTIRMELLHAFSAADSSPRLGALSARAPSNVLSATVDSRFHTDTTGLVPVTRDDSQSASFVHLFARRALLGRRALGQCLGRGYSGV
ncbi:hypothetical protein QTP88_014662 [Uroleucon formosanum]